VASCFSHPAVPLVLACWAPRLRRRALLVTAALLSAAPDLDAIGYFLGVPYSAWNGHRGGTHSLAAAVLVAGVLGPWLGRRCGVAPWRAIAFLAAAMGSHGLVDMCTDGGLGIALFWPFSDERLFFAFRPIAVAPIGVRAFFTPRGLEVLASEAVWIWAPALVTGAVGWCVSAAAARGQDTAAGP
jgi:inner membrane protein